MSEETTTSEAEPVVEAEPSAEAVEGFDPHSVPLDELEARITQEMGAEEQPAEAPSPEEPPAEEAAPQPEPTEEASQPLEGEDVSEEEAPPPGPEITPELIMARLEVAEAQAKHFEKLLGQRSGNEGYWQQRAQAAEQRLSAGAAPPPTDDPFDEAPVAPAPQPYQPAPPDPTTQWAVQAAAQQAAATMLADRKDLFAEDGQTLRPEFQQILTRAQSQIQNAPPVSDPNMAAQRVTAVLSSVLSEYDVVLKRQAAQEIEQKTVDQAERFKKKKRASASASTGARPVAKPKPLDPMTMPLEELQERIEKGRFTR